MRPLQPIPTLSLACLLACGPIAPPADVGSTSDATTTPSTTTAPSTTTTPTTSTPPDPTTTTSTPDETTHLPDPTTGATTTTLPGFIITPDGGTPGLHCNVWTQDCPRGQKCVPYAEGGGGSWNSLKCVDITGDGAPGDPCTSQGGTSGIDDCGLGIMCWSVDERGHGICVEQCSGSPESPMCPQFTSCSVTGEGIVNLCLPGCNPLLDDCPGDDLCIPNNDTFLCVLDASGDEGQVNDPCAFANSCDKGLLCLDPATASAACEQGKGCCTPFCEFPDAPCPNPDQQCTQWFAPMMPLPPGYESIGICRIPG